MRARKEAVASAALRDTLELRLEQQIDAIGPCGADAPALHHGRTVVVEDEVLADLGQTAVDAQPVLGHGRAVRPLPSQVQADRAPILHAGRRAPVPDGVLRPNAPAVVEASERRHRELETLITELHIARGRQGVLLRGVLKLDVGPGDDDVQGLVALRTLHDDVCLEPHAAEVRGFDTDARSGTMDSERHVHVLMVDHHVTGHGLRNRNRVRRHDHGLFDVALRTPVEDISPGELQSLDVRDRRREEEVIAGHRPVVPFLLARERIRKVTSVQRMT